MINDLLKLVWNTSADRLQLQAGLFCKVLHGEGATFVKVESAYNVPEAPLNGADNDALVSVIKECLTVGKTHEHAIGNWALSNIIKRLNSSLHVARVAIVSTSTCSGNHFCFLGFPQDNKRTGLFVIADGICKVLAETVQMRIENVDFQERLKVMELYVREVGHDLAGSMQAIIAKMAYIARGNLTETAMKTKAEEAWVESRNAYAIAECLGIAVDPDYSIGNSFSFPLRDFLQEVASDFESEAREKNMKILTAQPLSITLWGDRLPLKLAIVNLVKNAIKYGHSDSDVEVGCRPENDRILLFVRNKGIGLPRGEERKQIWDFGFRCNRAKKINVNGSGIGLFSCKKIVLSHEGQVWEDDHQGVTTFYISLPRSRFKLV